MYKIHFYIEQTYQSMLSVLPLLGAMLIGGVVGGRGGGGGACALIVGNTQ